MGQAAGVYVLLFGCASRHWLIQRLGLDSANGYEA